MVGQSPTRQNQGAFLSGATVQTSLHPSICCIARSSKLSHSLQGGRVKYLRARMKTEHTNLKRVLKFTRLAPLPKVTEAVKLLERVKTLQGCLQDYRSSKDETLLYPYPCWVDFSEMQLSLGHPWSWRYHFLPSSYK